MLNRQPALTISHIPTYMQAFLTKVLSLSTKLSFFKSATYLALIVMSCFLLLSNHSLGTADRPSLELKKYLKYCQESNTVPKIIWAFDFERNTSLNSLQLMQKRFRIPIILLNSENIEEFLDWPVHPAVRFLSLAHKMDYYMIYFTYHYGGGCSDTESIIEDWRPFFNLFDDLNIWIIGAPIKIVTAPPGIRFPKQLEHKMIGTKRFIARKGNTILKSVHAFQNHILDQNLEVLKNETKTHYPIRDPQLLGEIMTFKVIQYSNHVSRVMKNIRY